ncbi:Os08g0422800 [Oryza sativa Japonica Group]|uniref:Os08g0422800 protein n=2 Tax=Oryza sativa subsp. japonica TaxID=39947 RepID=C7J602_ORYSJ|nr:hypothetical protein EE612_044333 [Oryza sativa]BAH94315.1 Os08g0422900 [Oryza sativa Japonica Group]BAT05484.1 Os08g0422800 [Oryza sativa Japonica Group]|eukprot:NP_001175587.1 Os08g0422900 [Oryza sativa Japonica Group]
MAPPRVTAESTPRTRATSHPHPRPRPLPRSPNPNPNLPSSLHDSPPHADSSSPRAAPALPSPLTGFLITPSCRHHSDPHLASRAGEGSPPRPLPTGTVA